jgi:hypothetical protein
MVLILKRVARNSRSANRNNYTLGVRGNNLGFRVALSPSVTGGE